MKNFTPHIGKNVIETLTLGMYEDARIIYREYVQNAADAIDAAVENKDLDSKSMGKINIIIDKNAKLISIEDNGTGIRDKNVLSFLGDVANSQKDSAKQKGFRGIGRLGGLGYCEKLIFETTYKGESTKNIITLDAELLKKIIENNANTDDAATVMGTITDLKKENISENIHFFKVKLVNITNEILLNEESIFQYLSMVAPVPFSPEFEFKNKIYSYFHSNKRSLDEYDIHLSINNQTLFKPYKTIFYKTNRSGTKEDAKLLDVSCFTVENDAFELIAIGWFGITDKLNYQIPDENIERGVRLRKENITIGNELTLSKLFGQSRQNLNYIGEIHAFGQEFKPNARRDYFNDSKTTSILEKKLKLKFSTLGSLTQDSSRLHNRKKDIENYRNLTLEFETDVKSGKLTDREINKLKEDLLKAQEQALYSSNELKKLKQKSFEEPLLSTIYDHIIGELKIKIGNEEFDLESEIKSFPITLSKLSNKQKEIVFQIFSIMEDNLTIEKSEIIKKLIAEKFN